MAAPENKKNSGIFKRFGKGEFSSKIRQTPAKRRPGKTSAKMTAVENGGGCKSAAKRRQK
jgi:hypothetical protein